LEYNSVSSDPKKNIIEHLKEVPVVTSLPNRATDEYQKYLLKKLKSAE
jgi:hypothetical protein